MKVKNILLKTMLVVPILVGISLSVNSPTFADSQPAISNFQQSSFQLQSKKSTQPHIVISKNNYIDLLPWWNQNHPQLLTTAHHDGRIDFKKDQKSALQWSNRNYPKISKSLENNNEIDKINAINNQLRTKYLNRSEYYTPQEDLTNLDCEFITVAGSDITLYANLTTESFGINSTYFFNNSQKVFDDMLKNTQYGIDDGYFIGDLTDQPFNASNKEFIQIKLLVPKGTPMIRVGNGNESKFMIPRGQTLKYTDKRIDITGVSPHVYMTATWVDKKELARAALEKQDMILDQLEDDFYITTDDFIEIVPIGLNAGEVISNSQAVVHKTFDLLKDNNILVDNMFDKEKLVLSNGSYIYTEVFDIKVAKMNFEQKRNEFEKSFKKVIKEKIVGSTSNYTDIKTKEPIRSITAVSFWYLLSKDSLPKISTNDTISSTILHELFHYLIFINRFYVDKPMFNKDPQGLEKKSDVLKKQEGNALANLLGNSYGTEGDWEEYICEAFSAKYHPDTSIQNNFKTKLVQTNRFLDNIFDTKAPSIPADLQASEIEGNSFKLTFKHASDEISVDGYNIYQDGQLILTAKTKKDKNGLSYARPGDYFEKMEVKVGNLKQYTKYNFQVTAIDEAGNESGKSSILPVKTKDTEAPKIKGSLVGTALSSNTASFSWAHPTDNAGVKRIKLHRTENTSKNNLVDRKLNLEKVIELSANETAYVDATLVKGKSYSYYLTAVDEAGNESKSSNLVKIHTNDNDDKKQNEDKAKDVTFSHATLNWSGAFDGISTAGFNIFGWLFDGTSWTFSSVISVAGTATSVVVNLAPGMSHQFVVVPVDSKGNTLADGLKISVDSIDRSSIKVKDSGLYNSQKWKATNNFVSATDEDGKTVALNDPRITVTGPADTSEPGKYEVKYSFKGKIKTVEKIATITVIKDQTTVELQDIELYVGQKFDPDAPFKKVTYPNGKELKAVNIEHYYIDGVQTKELDTSKPGTHTIQISYHNAAGIGVSSKISHVTIKEDKSAIQTKDSELYVGQTWNKADNFISATDEEGNPVPFDDKRVITNDAKLDTSKPGVYTLKYSFKGVAKTTDSTFKVTVKEDKTTLELQDIKLYTGQKFDIDSPFKRVTDKDGNKIKAADVEEYYIDNVKTKVLDTSKPGTHQIKVGYRDALGNWKYSDSCTVTVTSSILLDDDFSNEQKSLFTTFNDPFYVTWVEEPPIEIDTAYVIVRYDPTKEQGLITKKPVTVLKNTNYIITSECSKNSYIIVRDVDTGEIYLSQNLYQKAKEGLKLTFSKDTTISIQLTAVYGGDASLWGFKLAVDVDNI